MILVFYNLLLVAALLASAPWWLWRMATTQKYREGLGQRLGRVPKILQNAGDYRPVIWLHAVSVGEVLAVSRLVGELKSTYAGHRLVISTTTRTGQDIAKERFGEDCVFYCPLDLPWAVRAYLKALQPRMLILAETEFWPNLLNGCFRRGIPVVVVNARISDRSWPRYLMLRRLWQPLLGRLSRALAQSDSDARRLITLGCNPAVVTVVGNLKFDVRAVDEADATRLLKTQTGSVNYVVAGSTLDGEEAVLLEAWPRLLAAKTQLAMILAPRHPDRFAAVASLLGSCGFQWVKRSDWKAQSAESQVALQPGQIVLLDSIGELASVYSVATVAFIGGSLIPAGGHNPLEPAQFGVPIVMGPNYVNFRTIVDDMRSHEAIRVVARDDLAGTLIDILQHPVAAKAMGVRAKEVFDQQAGATARSIEALRELLPGDAATTMKQEGAGLTA
jgi:3-deoxy-D-manno-octulosonic-acid transferase